MSLDFPLPENQSDFSAPLSASWRNRTETMPEQASLTPPSTQLPEAPLAMPVQDLTPAPLAFLERWLRARPVVRP